MKELVVLVVIPIYISSGGLQVQEKTVTEIVSVTLFIH